MNASELQTKSVEELKSDLLGLLEEQFKYRMQLSAGQLKQTHLARKVRRDIARVRTVINAKSRGNA